MPVADPQTYVRMLDAARDGGYAYPAINICSTETINAALRGFAEAGSDGLIQVSTGAGEFASGTSVKDMALGAVALAEFAHRVAEHYPVNIALTTDHCQASKVDSFLRPLLAVSRERVARGELPLFQSHMFDGSELPLDENMAIARELLARVRRARDRARGRGGRRRRRGGRDRQRGRRPRQALHVARGHARRRRCARHRRPRHVPLRGHVRERPRRLQAREREARAGRSCATARPRSRTQYGSEARFRLVFHGGSGSALEEIRETLDYGVVKMNVDTDTQYAFTRPIADHVLRNYDGVLKVDGEVGIKKAYDPRGYLKQAEIGMSERVVRACEDLRSAGRSIAAATV